MKIIPDTDHIYPDPEGELLGFFNSFVDGFSEKFSVPKDIFKNHYGVFELTISTTPRAEESEFGSRYVEDWYDIVLILTNWMLKNRGELGDGFFVRANLSLDKGVRAFGSMRHSFIKNSDDFTLQETTDNIFDSINRILEFMIKFEGFLISSKKNFDEGKKIPEFFPIAEVLKHCTDFLNNYKTTKVDESKLLSIPLNQWRNIAAHKNFFCKGSEVFVSYGRPTKTHKSFEREKLEPALLEIYRLRVNIKFCFGIALTIVTWKLNLGTKKLQNYPMGFLMDLNYFTRDVGIEVIRLESVKEFKIADNIITSQSDHPDHNLYQIEFKSKIKRNEDIKDAILSLSQTIVLIFNEHNSLPDKEKVIFHILDSHREDQFHLIRSFD